MKQNYDKEYESFKNNETNIDGNDNNAFVYEETNSVPAYKELEPEYKELEYKELELDENTSVTQSNNTKLPSKPSIAKKPLLPPKGIINPTFTTFTSYTDTEDTYDVVADSGRVEDIDIASLYAQVHK